MFPYHQRSAYSGFALLSRVAECTRSLRYIWCENVCDSNTHVNIHIFSSRESDESSTINHGVPPGHVAHEQPGRTPAGLLQLVGGVPGRLVAVLALARPARTPAAWLPAAHQLSAALGLRSAVSV